jgi:predicted nucleic acid-binding protein
LILVDTSIWVDHFRRRDDRLARLLDDRKVSMHPFVAGELAVGNLRNRDEILLMLNSLPATAMASHEEALRFISNFSLAGRGLGYIDIHLLAAVSLTPGTLLWSKDKRLNAVAESLSIPMVLTP